MKELRKRYICKMEQNNSQQESIIFHRIVIVKLILVNIICLCQKIDKMIKSYTLDTIKLLNCAEK